MANIAVVGAAGYVGLAYSVSLAAFGHRVIGVDRDPGRIWMLNDGVAPIHEPELPELLQRGLATGLLTFTTDYATAIPPAEFVFICVGTPSTETGAADTSAIVAAATAIARQSKGRTIVVNKSTMPVGSAQFVADILAEHAPSGVTFTVVSNPEFLREGSAIYDIFHPDRIVLGADDLDAAHAVGDLYNTLNAAILITQPRTAEMVKYASNAFLATKISFINEVALICDQLDADVDVVARGMGMDARITPRFLHAGLGFGGSCFPKDVRALAAMARENACDSPLLNAVLDINAGMRSHVIAKVRRRLGTLTGATIGLFGLSFKPETDDIREAPAISLIEELLAQEATVQATDPVANAHIAARFPEVRLAADAYGAAMSADAVILVTEWPAYRSLNLDRIANAMRGRLVVDGRNVLDPGKVASAGLVYEGIGRPRNEGAGTRITVLPGAEPLRAQPRPESVIDSHPLASRGD